LNNIIKVKSLSKSFGKIKAVDDISFSVKTGELFAFLGPNGAGKSTTIHILCTLLEKDSGDIEICGLKVGKDDPKIRRQIGVVFQENSLDNLLTVRQNLISRAYLYESNRKKILSNLDRVCSVLPIENLLSRPFGKLSGGQKRRCEIARAMMNSPRVLFLDEPSTGLDPQTRKNIWETINFLRKEQKITVFLTTHYLEETANATNIAIIDAGKIAAFGSPRQLQERFSTDLLKVTTDNSPNVRMLLTEINLPYKERENVFHIKVPNSLKALEILKIIENHLTAFEVAHGTIDDVFLNITGKNLREN
jgi:multidrug/hemolysin transport system ATP-binding protein